ncbi:hypothetical protein D3C81_1660950 [compost metagenome]
MTLIRSDNPMQETMISAVPPDRAVTVPAELTVAIMGSVLTNAALPINKVEVWSE